jgi:hypothetical protein
MTTKRRKRHTPVQIARKLRDADAMLNAGKEEAAVLHAEKKRLLPNTTGVVVEDRKNSITKQPCIVFDHCQPNAD